MHRFHGRPFRPDQLRSWRAATLTAALPRGPATTTDTLAVSRARSVRVRRVAPSERWQSQQRIRLVAYNLGLSTETEPSRCSEK